MDTDECSGFHNSFPPIPRRAWEAHADRGRQWQSALEERLDANVIQDIEELVVDDKWVMHDSYHIRGPAVEERTRGLIDAIKRAGLNPPPAGRRQAPNWQSGQLTAW